MPTYRNQKQGQLAIEAHHDERSGHVHSRTIEAGETFVVHSSAIPARWLQPDPWMNGQPWVTLVSESPTDEELSG